MAALRKPGRPKSPASLTQAQHSANSRAKLIASGGRRLDISLDPALTKRLAKFKYEQGCPTDRDAILLALEICGF
jgi:hypothetical protein